MTDQTALEPCPFCGGTDLEAMPPPFPHGFRCEGCGAEITLADTKAEAIAAWNTRPAKPALEPVAWMYESEFGKEMFLSNQHVTAVRLRQRGWTETPLYATPPDTRALLDEAREAMTAIDPYLDAIICFASTQGEYEPNKIAAQFRATLAKLEALK